MSTTLATPLSNHVNWTDLFFVWYQLIYIFYFIKQAHYDKNSSELRQYIIEDHDYNFYQT